MTKKLTEKEQKELVLEMAKLQKKLQKAISADIKAYQGNPENYKKMLTQ